MTPVRSNAAEPAGLFLPSIMPFRSQLLVLALSTLLPLAALAAPRPVRLYEIFVVRFTADLSGTQTLELGLLDSTGRFRVTARNPLSPGIAAPPDLLNRLLITGPTWFAYEILGASALGNFTIGTNPTFVGEQVYLPVAVADAAKLELGELVNISTRASVSPSSNPVIGGFVIVGSPRLVLVRGVGPALQNLGVTDSLPDPKIAVFKQGSNGAVASNDDWGQAPDAEAIAQAAVLTGAFPLPPSSKDAACLLELGPGTYTVHLSAGDASGGTALLEVYTLP